MKLVTYIKIKTYYQHTGMITMQIWLSFYRTEGFPSCRRTVMKDDTRITVCECRDLRIGDIWYIWRKWHEEARQRCVSREAGRLRAASYVSLMLWYVGRGDQETLSFVYLPSLSLQEYVSISGSGNGNYKKKHCPSALNRRFQVRFLVLSWNFTVVEDYSVVFTDCIYGRKRISSLSI